MPAISNALAHRAPIETTTPGPAATGPGNRDFALAGRTAVEVRSAAFDVDETAELMDYVEDLIKRDPSPYSSSSSFGSSSSSSGGSSSSSSDSSSSSSSYSDSSSYYDSSTSANDSCEGWVVCRPDGYFVGSSSSYGLGGGSSGGGSSGGSSSGSSGSFGSSSGSSSSSSSSSGGGNDGLPEFLSNNSGAKSGVSAFGLVVAMLATTAVLV